MGVDPAAYRKRLSRARTRLYDFVRGWCGVYDAANPCRCAREVESALDAGLLARGDLYLSTHRARPSKSSLDRAAEEIAGFLRVAEMMRRHPTYLTPEALLVGMRELLDSKRLELLRE